MRSILITGGTNFVSRYAAEYFLSLGDRVYVLNRGTKEQSKGVIHLKGDRNALTEELKNLHFDAVLDITAYTGTDVNDLLNALGDFGTYILVSSSAVYPETTEFPFKESDKVGANTIWGEYGTNKIDAERELLSRVPSAYILRPPYLYGQMQNLYREPFVFDCAEADRPFVLPQNGEMKLQFFHVEDLCRFMDLLIRKKPVNNIYNVGNSQTVSVKEWVTACYEVVGKKSKFINADRIHNVRSFFCFHDYEYFLDVSRMLTLMPDTKPLEEGIREEYGWYINHKAEMQKKPYMEYIDEFLLK